MTSKYTRYKTVRFEPETWAYIEIDAENKGITTSEFIRSTVIKALISQESPVAPQEDLE
ncbi:MAG: hypothetical protein JRI70_06240 [Deltaproteobacteria bacterium]|nr:hypothetical protein [Deltaproteobacteria bacterium]